MLHQVGVQRQDHERQVGINHTDVDRQVGVEDLQWLADPAHAHQETVEQAVVAEDAHPRIHADQDRGPGRHHDQQHQHRLHFLAGNGDAVGHRVADQQAEDGAEQRHLQRAQISGDVQFVTGQHGVVAQVKQQLQLLLGVAVDFGVGRNGHVRFGEADLQNDEERQHEEQEQPDEGNPDDQLAATGNYSIEAAFEFAHVHERSTTPLSSSQYTYTWSPQVGRWPRRSALATNDWTILPLGSST
ncbi:hypothetical protein D9M73_171000 [compost metagenome]